MRPQRAAGAPPGRRSIHFPGAAACEREAGAGVVRARRVEAQQLREEAGVSSGIRENRVTLWKPRSCAVVECPERRWVAPLVVTRNELGREPGGILEGENVVAEALRSIRHGDPAPRSRSFQNGATRRDRVGDLGDRAAAALARRHAQALEQEVRHHGAGVAGPVAVEEVPHHRVLVVDRALDQAQAEHLGVEVVVAPADRPRRR